MTINMHAFKTQSKLGKRIFRGKYTVREQHCPVDILPLEKVKTLYEKLSQARQGDIIDIYYNNIDPGGLLPIKAVVVGINREGDEVTDVWVKEILH